MSAADSQGGRTTMTDYVWACLSDESHQPTKREFESVDGCYVARDVPIGRPVARGSALIPRDVLALLCVARLMDITWCAEVTAAAVGELMGVPQSQASAAMLSLVKTRWLTVTETRTRDHAKWYRLIVGV